ncbi:uncharacterized protein LOC116201846 isoform X1 [Punica granatum]|uniref:Uncharacterized protein n=2 Tax=Punica granatum TaxID=22663 RepID=A0A2I0KND1_PUNGR|nr:uncharacterized protein LOC116201846 isoform X1 [Punica granatum]PKI69997.1 hypothetical protein CRG98_009600 [Punica granatum]
MSSAEGVNQNPSKWRFTWEAQSHHPTLKLFLFNPFTNPKHQCRDLKADLNPTSSVVQVSYATDTTGEEVSLGAPVPKVLIDYECPLSFRALDDHIEVKVVLLLPVDHPLVSNFDEVLSLAGDGGGKLQSDDSEPLSMATDAESLSANGGVDFYCRSCSSKLTRSPIRQFVEMPSVNWQEAADNWFGSCCCSFGGVSEKLVARYAKSYTALKGRCLLDHSAVIVCKDDFLGCQFPECDGSQVCEISPKSDLPFVAIGQEVKDHSLCCQLPASDSESAQIGKSEIGHCCDMSHSMNSEVCDYPCDVSEHKHRCLEPVKETELGENQKSFLNGFLGNVFMAKSYNLSATVEWVEFACPYCSALLGAYPSSDGGGPLDGGVRLYKCLISTDLPVLGSNDIFRKYTLEKMFANQILQNAKDELSFRTVIKDLRTRCPVVQIILLNPNSWYCSNYCLDTGSLVEPSLKVSLRPAIKVLFCGSRNDTQFQQGKIEQWSGKHGADEVFMLPRQIEALVDYLVSARELFPPSFTVLEGFNLSCMQR